MFLVTVNRVMYFKLFILYIMALYHINNSPSETGHVRSFRVLPFSEESTGSTHQSAPPICIYGVSRLPRTADCARVEAGSLRRRSAQLRSGGSSLRRRGRRAGRRLQWRRSGPWERDHRRGGDGRCPDRHRVLVPLPPAASPGSASAVARHIPVHVGLGSAGSGAGAAAGERSSPAAPSPPRCLARPARISLRETRRLDAGRPADGAAISDGSALGPNSAGRLGRPAPPASSGRRIAAVMKIDVLNIQSLLPKLPDITADVTEAQPHVLCYTETNLRSATPNRLISIPGYSDSIHRSDRKVGRKKCGGGVIVLTKNALKTETLLKTSELNQSQMETVWVKIKLDERRSVIVSCIYRSPSTMAAQNERDFDEIERQLGEIIQRHDPSILVISGDFNADPVTNPAGASQLNHLLDNFGMRMLVQQPTFHRGDTASRLDNILVYSRSAADLAAECGVERCPYTSHHYKLTACISVPRHRQPRPSYRMLRDWRRIDLADFHADLDSINWGRAVPRSDPCELQWDKLVSSMEDVLNRHAPIRAVKIRNPAPPPITDDTRDLIVRRRQAIAAGDETSYAALNTEVKRAIRGDYRSDIQRRVDEAPSSALWRQLRPIIAPKLSSPAQPENLTTDDLNRYFTSVGEETHETVIRTFQESGRTALPPRLPRVHADALRLMPVSLEELKRTIYSIPHKTSVADGVLDIRLIKLAFPIIGRVLLQVINRSIVSETVPNSWKRAVVIPLHKKGELTAVENFRPITNVPMISKIIEKLVCAQVDSYMKRNSLYSIDQHGFRNAHSTATALVSITDHLLQAKDRGDVSILTLIDLSRAFDVVHHRTLLDQLQLLQIAPGWFQSYLSDHRQCVRLAGGETSAPLPINIGIFQGSCMGPMLYNIASISAACYVPTEVDGFLVRMARYADDTQLVISGPRRRLPDMQVALEKTLDTLATYFMQNGMKINAAKTELMVIGDRSALQTAATGLNGVQFVGESLQPVLTAKNLGVIFDDRLSFEPHIDAIVAKCFGILIGLMHAKHLLPISVLPTVVSALVMSHIRYCSQVFGCANKTAVKRLQKVQNFAARIISGRHRSQHVSDVIRSLNWLPVAELMDFNDLCLLHKIIMTGEPAVLRQEVRYNRDVIERATRHSDFLYLPRFRTNAGKTTFMHRACSLYNAHVIGSDMQGASYARFKRLAKVRLTS